MDKNPPANEGDAGSIRGLGRFHMPSRTKPVHHNDWSFRSRACAPQQEKPLLATVKESLHAATETQCNQKYINKV